MLNKIEKEENKHLKFENLKNSRKFKYKFYKFKKSDLDLSLLLIFSIILNIFLEQNYIEINIYL